MFLLFHFAVTLSLMGLLNWVLPIVIGLAGSFWLGMRFRSKSQMAYQLHNFTLIAQPNTNLGGIKILFHDIAVPRVVVTKLTVWNSGNTVVNGGDVVASDPLGISIEDGALILDAQRVKATQDVNDFRIRISGRDRSRAFLEFDYLNGGDGANFQIIHTGASGKAKVTGSIRGIAKGVENRGDLQEWSEQKSFFSGLQYPALVSGAVIILLWLTNLISTHYPNLNRYKHWLGIAFGGLVLFLFLAALATIIVHIFRTRSRAAPKSLSR